MALLRRLLPSIVLASAAALGCGVAGFVYSHEPVRDQVVVAVDRDHPAGAPVVLSGTVTRVGDGRLVIESDGKAIELALPPAAPVEDLQRVAPSVFTPGMQVNVGAERSDTGVLFSGVVVVAGR